MSLLSKEDVLKAQDAKFEEIAVPEWGGTVRVSTMSGFAKERFEASLSIKNGNINATNVRAKLVAACLVDEKGDLIFNESDIEALSKKSCLALDRVVTVAQRLNIIGDAEVEKLAKN